MVDYLPLRPNNWKLHAPDQEPEEEQAVCEPIVDIVWNAYTEKGDAKSMALKVSIRLPLTACRCPHCDAAEQTPIHSRTHHMTEA
jgi:hypothetical protein